jgi:carbonic anhydrase
MQIFATAIEPAARACRDKDGDWWQNAVAENVRLNAERLRTTPILREAVAKQEAEIVGGVYDLATGTVTLV